MNTIINKIRKIKESRIEEDERYFLKIINNLEYIYVEQWDKTSEIYRYDGCVVILKKKNENIIYVNDFIWNKIRLDFGYNDDSILKLVRDMIERELNWKDYIIRPYDRYEMNMIDDVLKSGKVK